MSVKVDDLIGRKYKPGAHCLSGRRLDCVGACCGVLMRLGLVEAMASLTEIPQISPDPAAFGWRPVNLDEEPLELGDIYLSEMPSGHLNVAAVYQLHPPLALTSHPDTGVVGMPVDRLSNLLGIYRWSDEGAPGAA